jgi:hypothetical protein
METERIISLCKMYQKRFQREKVPKDRMDPKRFPFFKEEMIAHAHSLLDEILEEFARNPENVSEPGYRLGFIQALLWAGGWYTSEEILQHNRP